MKNIENAPDFTPSAVMSALVNEEVRQDSFYHPNLAGITQGGMANHYPMTIMAMHGLGASDQDIVNFRDSWPRHRAAITGELGLKDLNEVTTQNWRQYLGQSDKLREFRRVFLQLFDQGESAEVITELLDAMKPGLPMGLFHPLIRLSFATGHGDSGLIADALAYMAIRYQDLYLEEPAINPELLDLLEADASLSAASHQAGQSWLSIRQWLEKGHLPGRLSRKIYGGSISICEQLCREQVIHQLALGTGFTLDEDELTPVMAGICQAAARLYLFEPALTTLHGVTSCQALAELTLRYINRENQAVYARLWRYFWVWLTALYIEKGCPRLSDLFPETYLSNSNSKNTETKEVHHPDLNSNKEQQLDLVSWPKLKRLALRSQEVHVMKMIYSCDWLYRHISQDSAFQLAAIKALPQG
ncbi:questin oxidase family protein [Thalassomonas actiniarum]|uniref:Questin oxidase family protein n=1 Tax=Thalassomonas actiniarum TaxID=485447 RepID=A0AAE9YKP7_9GAMM|nr:questin oxidase family protein [Thalassomonas actiniarum]WDD97230.1 questin oxidase family protein [Thalassomonas actiniarum]